MESRFQYVLSKIKGITTAPGCYLMKDAQGEIFYIGKAKNLRARLKSYFLGTDTRLFVQYLEHILYDIEVVVVHNDTEALILERELIRKHQPRYNIALKDDKNYILLKLKKPTVKGKKKDIYPRLEIVRKSKKDQARYFGPYPSASKLRITVDLINKYFMLRTCSDQIIENRARPCIQYQIGRCLAPCVYDVPTYHEELENTALFLSGNIHEIEKRLNHKMWLLAESEQYEAAANVRDQLSAIRTSLEKQVVANVNQRRNQDIIGFHRVGPEVLIMTLCFRQGIFETSRQFSFSDQFFPDHEIIRSFIEQAYEAITPENIPHDILVPHATAEDFTALQQELEQKCGHAVHIGSPTRGMAKKLVLMANKNAEAALVEKLKKISSDEQSLVALQNILGLKMIPRRIECIDISLIQGSEPFGSLVVFINGVADSAKYRLFKIKSVEGMDDFSMIHEVVSRRISRGIKTGDLPDLLLIDGGKGQLNAALSALSDHNILVSHQGLFVAGIAKARTQKEGKLGQEIRVEHSSERLFVPGQAEPIMLKPHTFERYLVERIRDEAHRFALKAHRKSRSKRTLSSALLRIPGIGKKRALMLLKHFGSIHKVKEAHAQDIADLLSISEAKAQAMLDELNTGMQD